MNVLVLSSRLPVALDLVRKLGRRGHRVVAADSVLTAPGSHSRFARSHALIASAEYQPERFLRDVQALVLARGIELVVPCFEEVFVLRHAAEREGELAPIFAAPFSLLRRLHDKFRFAQLAAALGFGVPETEEVRSGAELRDAIARRQRFFAHPALSRGGLELFTNTGPLAGALALDDCQPTPARPWIVQDYVDGQDRCGFAIALHGRLAVAATYVHPREIEHAGGIVFESVRDDESVALMQRLIDATRYHGMLGLDFRRNGDGTRVLECNPRPTAGLHLVPDAWLDDAITGEDGGALRIVPAGRRRKYSSALLRDLVLHPRSALADLRHLLSAAPDVYAERGDRVPALYQALSYLEVLLRGLPRGAAPRSGARLVAAYLDGISWNGEPLP
jgi:hypothetical protein